MHCLGGAQLDYAWDVAVDSHDNVIVVGETYSTELPSVGGSGGGCDALIAKLSPRGDVLWAERFGGSGTDLALSVAADPLGGFYITGATTSTDLNVTGDAYHGGDSDAFVARFSDDGSLAWARYLGTSANDIGATWRSIRTAMPT